MTQKIQHSTSQIDSKGKFWLDAPIRTIIYPTNKCNYLCNHCYASDFLYKELTLQEYSNIFRKLSDFGVFEIVFLGGEPFLRKDFLDIAYTAREIGLGVKVSTNASLINGDNIKRIHDLFDGKIQVSLDSVIQETNDSIRGDGSFIKTIKGIDELLDNNTEFSLGMVVNRLNYNELPEIYEFARERDIKGLHIMRIMPKGRAILNWEKLSLTNEEWTKAIKDLRKSAVYNLPKLQIDGTYEYSNLTEPLGKCMSGCEAGRYELTIMSDGTVVPCDAFNEIEIGDINKIDLKSMWQNNPILNRFRSSKNNLEGECSNCEIDFCIGCRYQAYSLNKGFYNSDPFCVREELLNKNE